jgi:hypothetical protein
MTRIVTTHYRYKRPPRKRKPVALDMPAVVAAKSRRPVGGTEEAAAEVMTLTAYPRSGETGATQPSTPREAARVIAQPPANDDPKSAMATKPALVTAGRKRRTQDGPHLPMELPLSRKPIERDGDDYKRLKASMARRLRDADGG